MAILQKRVSVKRSYGCVCDWGRTHIAVERKHTEWRDHRTNLNVAPNYGMQYMYAVLAKKCACLHTYIHRTHTTLSPTRISPRLSGLRARSSVIGVRPRPDRDLFMLRPTIRSRPSCLTSINNFIYIVRSSKCYLSWGSFIPVKVFFFIHISQRTLLGTAGDGWGRLGTAGIGWGRLEMLGTAGDGRL
jgi:hypothetical protein